MTFVFRFGFKSLAHAGIGALAAMAIFFGSAAASFANEVSTVLVVNNAVEPQAFFSQPVVSGQIKVQRQAPYSTLNVVVNVSGSADLGTDYNLFLVAPDGSRSAVLPSSFVPATSPDVGFTGTITIPQNAASVTLEITPLADDLIEGAETVVIGIRRNPAVDYVVKDSTAREIIITDANVQLSLNAVRPRASEYNFSSGSVVDQPFLSTLGAFQYHFAASPNSHRVALSPARYRVSMTRSGNAKNSYEPIDFLPNEDADFDLTLGASIADTGSNEDTVLGYELVNGSYVQTGVESIGSTEIELASSLAATPPGPGHGVVNGGWAPSVSRFDVISFSNQPGVYLVVGVVPPLYNTGNLTTSAVTLLRPGYIILNRPLSPLPLVEGDVLYDLGASLGSSLADRRVVFGTDSPWAVGANSPPDIVGVLHVNPYDDDVVEGAEEVGLSLIASGDYILRTPQSDKVTIADDDSVLSIASVTDAVKGGANGLFRISLTKPLPIQSIINYAISGTAVNGTDVVDSTGALLSGTISLPAGTTSFDLVIRALNIVAGDRSLTITVSDSMDYLLSGSGSGSTNPTATINIFDSGTVAALPVISIARLADAQEGGAIGAFLVSLSATSATALTVPFSVSGTAVRGVDFINPGISLVIPANTLSAAISIVPIIDNLNEGPETVIVALDGGDGYQRVGGTSFAQLSILDKAGTGNGDNPSNGKVEQNGGGCGAGGGIALLLAGLLLVLVRFRIR